MPDIECFYNLSTHLISGIKYSIFNLIAAFYPVLFIAGTTVSFTTAGF